MVYEKYSVTKPDETIKNIVFNILINWWNKIYGKQLNENGISYSNRSGVDWEYLYDERSKGNFATVGTTGMSKWVS